ncbi:MAG: type II toxin-antitoxin system VapC family toxin [Candidatus Omnitrophica bacterium]|nr:type II toxin-antitoxin system VapC family toxin [Candidatus Omnitrophota bacterium]
MPMKIEAAPLLLDTHTWLWLMNGNLRQELPEINRQVELKAEKNAVYISAISLLEVAMLDAKGRIELPMDCLLWIKRALNAPGIEVEDLSPEVAVASTRLADAAPRDPSDRVIIASAMSLGAVLVTRDREIISYCEANELPCLAF